MIFITLKTNKILTLKQQRELKLSLNNLTYDYSLDCSILIHLEQEQVIYLNTKMIDCIVVQCCLNGNINTSHLNQYKEQLLDNISYISDISKDNIFIQFES